MPLLLDTAKSAAAVELRSGNCITIGLVNNMPDAALEATERQFVALIRAAATGCVVRLKLFAMAEVPRGERARKTSPAATATPPNCGTSASTGSSSPAPSRARRTLRTSRIGRR